ncbi:MAG: hypothetical protein R6U29_12105 [Desulfosudaceae bacterium]
MRTILLVLMVLVGAVSVTAAPLPREDVPEPLQPWIDWVLHGQVEKDCPLIYNDVSRTLCAWPSPLEISFTDDEADFSQTWTTHAPGTWIELPGGKQLWPQQVVVNGKKEPVAARQGRPAVYLKTPGAYLIQGGFIYDQRPAWIRIPETTGAVNLVIDGRTIDFPRLEKSGRLWLRRQVIQTDGQKPENRLQVRVQRLVKDGIPLRLTTRLELMVSGQHRNVRLGQAATSDFIPMDLSSSLPARIDRDGQLLAQVRPGQWTIEITARHIGPAGELSPSTAGRFDADQEIWAFEAQRQLRLVDIKGPPQIDVRQTDLPGDWKQFPAYLMKPDTVMRLIEKKRGDPEPEPDQLSLHRTLWLDFDGQGYSARDRITGTMTTGWRLEANPPLKPGRVTVNGRERFITRLENSPRVGVEMRFGRVDLTAESRISGAAALPVTGWDRDFQAARGILNLPPGWSLLSASGIDNIQQTWFKKWSLLDLFFVFIIAVAMARLYRWYWGLAALVTMVLIIHEPGAPVWLWLHLLIAVALLRVVPPGKIRTLVNSYRLACLVLLIAVSLPFMVSQVRDGFYPQLERSWQTMADAYSEKSDSEESKSRSAPPRTRLAESSADMSLLQKKTGTDQTASSLSAGNYQRLALHQFDVKSKVQTGPGIPGWQWHQVKFAWNGPVTADEQMKFIFISPRTGLVLALLRTVFLALLIYGLSGMRYRRGNGLNFSRVPLAAVLLPILGGLLLSAPSPVRAQADFPPEFFLEELKSRLTEAEQPVCAPECATSPRLRADLNEKTLTIDMEIHCLSEQVAVPLPASSQHWIPRLVIIDDQPADRLYRDPETGSLWLPLSRGVHRLHLSGALPSRNSVELPLPLKPGHVSVSAKGWTVSGLRQNGRADDQLQFTRIRRPDVNGDTPATIEPGRLPDFFEISRVLHLGLDWQIETTVQRLTSSGAAAVLEIPLLAGESVTSDMPVEDGQIRLNLGPQTNRTGWTSSLDRADRLVLEAADSRKWSEIWRLDVGTLWHVEMEGIPVIQHQDQTGNWLPEWRPWPGEKVTLIITRPEGVEGPTFTVENSRLTVKPGKRVANTELELNLLSSRGSQHEITLPENSSLQAVTINGNAQSVRQEGRSVALPLTPGRQQIKLVWRQQADLDWHWQTPAVDLNTSSVDAFTSVHLPRDRWVLFCGGPDMGPAVLFWSLVLVIALLSLGLSRVSVTPLRFHHWFLLGLGLTQASLLVALPVAAWFLALGYRRQLADKLSGAAFNLTQLFLVALTAAAAASLFYGIKHGLLGYPDMQIAGNGSSAYLLQWYQDITGSVLPRARIISLPLFIYRVLILAWAIWIAFAFIKWLGWGWECWSTGGRWHPVRLPRIRPTRPWSAGAAASPDAKHDASPADDKKDNEDLPPGI